MTRERDHEAVGRPEALTPRSIEALARRVLSPEGDPEHRRELAADWRRFVAARFRLTAAQRANLGALPEREVALIQDALRNALDSSGEVSFTPATGSSPGRLTVHAQQPLPEAIKIPLIDCSFNADCTGWHCGPPKPPPLA